MSAAIKKKKQRFIESLKLIPIIKDRWKSGEVFRSLDLEGSIDGNVKRALGRIKLKNRDGIMVLKVGNSSGKFWYYLEIGP